MIESVPGLLQPVDRVAVLGTRLQMPGVPADHLHGDEHGMLAGNWRVLGAVARYMIELEACGGTDDYIATPIVFTGGLSMPVDGIPGADFPTEAAAQNQQFEAIITQVAAFNEELAIASAAGRLPQCSQESVSVTTYSGLKAVIEQLADEDLNSLEVITGLYHVPRAQLMTHDIVEDLDLDGLVTVTVRNGESYASKMFGDSFDRQFTKAYTSALGSQRLYHEAVGVAAYLADMYNSVQATQMFKDYNSFTAEKDNAGHVLRFILTRHLASIALSGESAADPKYFEHMIELLENSDNK